MSFEQNWGAPEAYTEAQQRVRADTRRRAELAAEEREPAATAALDRRWDAMDATEQARIDAQVEGEMLRKYPDLRLSHRLPRVTESLRQEIRRELLARDRR